MKITKKIWIALSIGLLCYSGYSQDSYFGQFYSNKVILNPAFTGSDLNPRLVLNYRRQWVGIEGGFATAGITYDQFISTIGGFGISVVNDNAGNGALKSNEVNLSYCYANNLTRRTTLRAGIQAGYFQKQLNKTILTYEDMIDKRYGFINHTQEDLETYTTGGVDFAGGLALNSKNYFAGLAVHHLIEPNISITESAVNKLRRKYTFNAGVNIQVKKIPNDPFYITPTILFQHQGNFDQMNFGLYGTYKNFTLGVWSRMHDAYIVMLGIQIEKLHVGYSYEYTYSDLQYVKTKGSHELSVTYLFPTKTKQKKYKISKCPSPSI